MRIWIDADAAPREVKELVYRAAQRLGVPAVLVANQRLHPPVGNALVTAVWVDGGPDVADQHIATESAPGDLVITQDVPLAALLVPNGVAVLDPRGEEHTTETIGEKQAFASALDRTSLGCCVPARRRVDRHPSDRLLSVGKPAQTSSEGERSYHHFGAQPTDEPGSTAT